MLALSLAEKILFVLAVLIAGLSAYHAAVRIARVIRRGRGQVDWSLARRRLPAVIARIITLHPTFGWRFYTSLFHAFVAWAFLYYLLVNLGDTLEGFFPRLRFLGAGLVGNLYRLGADVLSVAALAGMTALLIRRFVLKSPALTTRAEILLQPAARRGIQRDSAIVAAFILVHVGSRLLGQSVEIAAGEAAGWQPFAALLAPLWHGLTPFWLSIAWRAFFWGALGAILLFIPYFLYSKHLHLFFAPLNHLLKPERRSMGQLERLNFMDETIEQFGASRLEDLGWEQIMDAYACIMCYRCQEVCPAYNTGKALSPAAMEINKRYLLNAEGARLARGEASTPLLIDWVIPPQAVWACTACGACVDICPTHNEPMRDILDIRRALVLMENAFPPQLQTAFRGMERAFNPWNIPPAERTRWTEGLKVPTVEENPKPEFLWWVGCAPAIDPRAQRTARAFAHLLNEAGVNYAILGNKEQCTGDSARRAGNEFLFNELASANVEQLNAIAASKIVVTCPHCLHTLQNEYPAFGGNYSVIHHTQLIQMLLDADRLKLSDNARRNGNERIAFHDPCYLGRQNGILQAPRQTLQQISAGLIELPRRERKSFCCGAGGAQIWKEEEHGAERVSHNRMREVASTGAASLATACPFCLLMLTDASKVVDHPVQVLDIAEIVVARLADHPQVAPAQREAAGGEMS